MEHVTSAVEHCIYLLEPLDLLLGTATLEDKRSLQIGDFDAMVGTRLHSFLDFEATIAEHDKADQVILLRVQVG